MKKDTPPGYGKLLDAWSPTIDAGDPVAVLATSFTFAPAFFEEECLGRFLQLQSNPQEDGAAYLIEREEKLAQIACAAVIVDRQHCRGSRNLRWDMLPAHVPRAVLHAKVALLHWNRRVRLLVTSANLTEDGYRRNLEIFGVVDFYQGSPAPRAVLDAAVEFLRNVAGYARRTDGEAGPATKRWLAALERVAALPHDWGQPWGTHTRDGWGVAFIGVGPGRPDAFEQLTQLWGFEEAPESARVVSPFFDPPEVPNEPARRLWQLLRQHGPARVTWAVTAENIPAESAVRVHAPRSLLDAQPRSRRKGSTRVERIELPSERPLHAKAIWLENARQAGYMMGSSNFTSPGLGLGPHPNVEANLVYLVRRETGRRDYGRLRQSFPATHLLGPELEIRWEPLVDEDQDGETAAPALPDGFGEAVFDLDADGRGVVTLTFRPPLPAEWVVLHEQEGRRVLDAAQWQQRGEPQSLRLLWSLDRPPSGFRVRLRGAEGFAWWPVQVRTPAALPPPNELKALSLEVLLEVLTSARPLHKVLSKRNRQPRQSHANDDVATVDPHQKVDVSRFLLQRTRRVSWALAALRERLERPAVSEAALQWRLRGPVGVMALADALQREARSDDEAAFLLCELALEVGRVKPRSSSGCIPESRVRAELQRVIADLQERVARYRKSADDTLWQYVEDVFAEVGC